MKRFLSIIFSFLIIFGSILNVSALEIKEPRLELNVKSAVLMEASTGTVLYSLNMDEALPPASVTKIMTLLLTFEALDRGTIKLEEMLTVSEHASSMGGSQVYLEPGEEMSVNELIKCVVVASANDAALTLAERIGGSEEAFVDMMNRRAKELGMNNTNFENVTGLDDAVTNHVTSAYDIALMSKELLKHEKITEYTTIWMDTIRNGEFGLTNTNRMVKYYKGITGLKTGYTSSAGFCISASAKRDNLHLIAVIMGAETSNERNLCATKLLDFGFANYKAYEDEGREIGKIKVNKGIKQEVAVEYLDYTALENSEKYSKIKKEIILDESVDAPVKKGDVVGKIIYKIDGVVLGENDIIVKENVEEITFFRFLAEVVKNFISI
jgi:D-alanyl-D-alanine carboxypeptidase (penicillin-binding protein 5/6)